MSNVPVDDICDIVLPLVQHLVKQSVCVVCVRELQFLPLLLSLTRLSSPVDPGVLHTCPLSMQNSLEHTKKTIYLSMIDVSV